MRRPRQQAEPRRLAATDFEVLDRVAAEIQPRDGDLAHWFGDYWRQHRHRLAGDLHLIRQQVQEGAEVLECGAVPLLMTGALAHLGYRVRAVDLAPQRFAEALDRLQLEVHPCDIETQPLPFADGTFDTVLFNELFEHLRIQPIHSLREVHRVLRPDGTLLLSTPNLRSFRGLRNLILHNQGHAASAGVYRQYEKLETLGHMGHVREYTTREVSEFLERLGFRIDTIVYRGGHGRGIVGWAERLMPSMRPFFALVARKERSRL